MIKVINFAILFVLIVKINCQDDDLVMLGAWDDVDRNKGNETIDQILNMAIEKINKKSESIPNYKKVNDVSIVKSQVVAGINYFIAFKTTLTKCSKKIQLNSQYLKRCPETDNQV